MDSNSWVPKDIIELTLPFGAMLHVEEPKPSPSGGDIQRWFCIPKWAPRGDGLPFVELGLDGRPGVRRKWFEVLIDGELPFSFADTFGLL